MLTVGSMTGMDLRLLRVSKRVRVGQLARAMGVSHPRISQIETLAVVNETTTLRYLEALRTLEVAA